jgi:hypothetical protein
MARLRRVSDGFGDEGSSVIAIRVNPDNDELEYIETDKPLVGYSLQVGSLTARSYSNQDWWMTTTVEEILEHKDNYYKFRTGNSVYEFWY